MFFTVQTTLLALAASSILPSVLAGPLPGSDMEIESREPGHHHDHDHKKHSVGFAEKKAIKAGKELLLKAATLSDKTKWAKEAHHTNWTKHYGPGLKHNLKSGLLSTKDQKYLSDILKTFSVDAKTEKFQKFVLFTRKGLHGHNGTHNGTHTHHNGTAKAHSLHSSNSTSTTGDEKKDGNKSTLQKIKDKVTGKGKKQHHVSKHHGHGKHHNKHPRLPILRASISPKVVIIKSLHKSHDHNKKKHQLHLSELLYQGLKETGSKATTFIREAPKGKTMKVFIKKALKAAGSKGVLKADSTDKHVKKMFAMMLGTPAGRTIELICIKHAAWFGGKSIKEIRIEGKSGKESVIFIVS